MVTKKAALTMFLFVLIVALVAPKIFAVEKLDLKLRLESGQKYGVRVATINKIKQTIGGKQQNINHSKTVGLDFKVEEVDKNGVASLTVTYRSLQEKTVTAGGEFKYDSTDPCTAVDTPLAPTYAAMMGKSFAIKVTPQGRIVKLEGLDEMFSRMAEKMLIAEDELIRNLPPGTCSIKSSNDNAVTPKKEKMSTQERANKRIEGLNKQYGSREKRKEALREMIKKYPFSDEKIIMELVGNVIMLFPEKAVGIGDSWKGRKIAPAVSPIEADSTCTLKKDEKSLVEVAIRSNRILKDEAIISGKGPSRRMDVKMTGTISCQGQTQVNKASGWIISKTVKTRLSGQMTQPGMTVPMSIESIVTVKLM